MRVFTTNETHNLAQNIRFRLNKPCLGSVEWRRYPECTNKADNTNIFRNIVRIRKKQESAKKLKLRNQYVVSL